MQGSGDLAVQIASPRADRGYVGQHHGLMGVVGHQLGQPGADGLIRTVGPRPAAIESPMITSRFDGPSERPYRPSS